MNEVYLVKDGILKDKFSIKNKEQVKNTNFHIITIDFKRYFGKYKKEIQHNGAFTHQ
jgi:hypothetical protein